MQIWITTFSLGNVLLPLLLLLKYRCNLERYLRFWFFTSLTKRITKIFYFHRNLGCWTSADYNILHKRYELCSNLQLSWRVGNILPFYRFAINTVYTLFNSKIFNELGITITRKVIKYLVSKSQIYIIKSIYSLHSIMFNTIESCKILIR